jgi:glyoxylase-like metal-dependent hydrolase (beta-lactamase superfamily II)
MLFRQLFDAETWTFSYLIADPASQEALLVDPVLEQVDRDLKYLQELGLTLRYCLETHVHADHITGAGKLRDHTGCQTLVPAGAEVDCADRHLQDNELLQMGVVNVRAIATPGHTDSHMAFWIKEGSTRKPAYLLTGDALFIRGCGRTDFQSGDAGQLYDAITQRIFTLPDETWIYPGHDYRGFNVSTVGEEKRLNPRLTSKTREEFVTFMNNLNLPNPKKISEAVPANQGCGKLPRLNLV